MSIKPFSGSRYKVNSRYCSAGATPCALCGRPIKDASWNMTVVVTDGGSTWGTVDSDENDSGYMGCWPVGADCAKILRAAGVAVYNYGRGYR